MWSLSHNLTHLINQIANAVFNLLPFLYVNSYQNTLLTKVSKYFWRSAQESNLQVTKSPTDFKSAPSPPGHTPMIGAPT